MKIEVNYDLLEKIDEAKTGVNLNKMGRDVSFMMSIMTPVCLLTSENDLKNFAGNILYSFSLSAIHYGLIPFLFRDSKKERAKSELKDLTSKLCSMDIYTNDELLLEANNYKTKYKINFNDGILPKLKQNKYIMVPTKNAGEVSLLQEHVVGTRKYDLSVGEPEAQKQYKLSYNGV